MDPSRPPSFYQWIVGLPPVWILLWVGLTGLTIALLVLMRTSWGQSRPLRKCAVLSLFAHALLACFATTVRLVNGAAGPDDAPINVSLSEGDQQSTSHTAPVSSAQEQAPWDSPAIRSEEPPAQPPDRSELEDDMLAKRPVETPEEDLTSLLNVQELRPAKAVAPEVSPATTVPHKPVAPPQATQLAVPAPQKATAPEVPTPADTPKEAAPVASKSSEPTRKPATVETPAAIQPLIQPDSLAELSRPEPVGTALVPVEARLARMASPLPPASLPEPPAEVAVTASPAVSASVAENNAGAPAQNSPATPRVEHAYQLPTIYSQREAHDRLETVRRNGGGADTEAAVEAALKWLAANQEPDGHWDANRHGAGRETHTLGHNRERAGLQANTGMTALALLAFMGSGHTHQSGTYQEPVRFGLQYLLNSQGQDGNLAGEATFFARMYCHGMAAFALAEAFAMTGDVRLKPAVQAAIQYTVRAQRRNSGGWRYQPGDYGDTSQTGWQLMTLKSAELAGEVIPVQTRADADRFLTSVTGGQFGGLASYRPNHAVSRSMTAEAMYCRQLMGQPISPQAAKEAALYLLGELPGRGEANLYYWYYATLCLYYQQGEAWDRWNTALKETLLKLQVREGELAGSWDTQTVWGGYGGRVYTTSMATMNLEIYYRYLPIHLEQARRAKVVR